MRNQTTKNSEFDHLPTTRKEAKERGSATYFTGKKCKQGHNAPRRTHNGECKECQRLSDKNHRERNKSRRSQNFKDWYEKNRDQQLVRMKKWQKNNRNWFNGYENEKRHNNKQYRIAKSLRDRIYKAVERGDKSASTKKLLGCSIDQLIEHIENQFTDGMSWSNYGKWHIDHIRPCISFDLTDPIQQEKCFNYKNLQPLWEFDNKSKGGKYQK